MCTIRRGGHNLPYNLGNYTYRSGNAPTKLGRLADAAATGLLYKIYRQLCKLGIHQSPRRRPIRRPTLDKSQFFVVVPFYNEAAWIGRTLDSLAAQTDQQFTIVLVNNCSTDNTVEVVEAWHIEHPVRQVEIIEEAQKGTGAAADTGFRYAINKGERWWRN